MYHDSTRSSAYTLAAQARSAAVLLVLTGLAACADDAGEKMQPVQTTPSDEDPNTEIEDQPDAAAMPHLLAGPGETCWFEELGTTTWCEGAGAPNFINPQAESLQDCADACIVEPTCTAIIDWFWLEDYSGPPCLLHTAGCENTQPGVEESQSFFYRKVCGKDPPPGALVAFSDVTSESDAGGGDSGASR
jgi:hypothetical protein